MLHHVCAGLGKWLWGPFHCGSCRKWLAAKSVRNVILNSSLVHVVYGGQLSDLEDRDWVCFQRSTGWFWWDRQLQTIAGGNWRVTLLAERVSIMQEAA